MDIQTAKAAAASSTACGRIKPIGHNHSDIGIQRCERGLRLGLFQADRVAHQ